jgi:hypothetical protein
MFSKLEKEEIINSVRYDTGEKHSRLLGYTEAIQVDGFMSDKLLFIGKYGRAFLSIQRPKRLKNGDDSVRIIPLTKSEAKERYKDLAVYETYKISETETTDIFDFDTPIKA